MKIKMAAMDLDDTLLDGRLGVSDTNKKAIAKASEAGIKIVLASGRMFCSMEKYARLLKLETPIISYNGAMIKIPGEANPVFHRPVPLEIAGEIIREFSSKKVHINVYVRDKLYVEEINQKALDYAGLSQVPVYKAGNLLDFLQEPPTKLLLIEKPSLLDSWIEPLRNKYGHLLHITKSKPNYLEFLAKDINKGTALKFLMEYYSLERDEVMAIGDSFNDIEMLQAAGIGVAVDNALPEIKTKAAWVVSSNLKDGVAEALERAMS